MPTAIAAEQERAERLLEDLLQRLVEAAGLLRVVGDARRRRTGRRRCRSRCPWRCSRSCRTRGTPSRCRRSCPRRSRCSANLSVQARTIWRDAVADDRQPDAPTIHWPAGQVHQLLRSSSPCRRRWTRTPIAIWSALTPDRAVDDRLAERRRAACAARLAPSSSWWPDGRLEQPPERPARTCRSRPARSAPSPNGCSASCCRAPWLEAFPTCRRRPAGAPARRSAGGRRRRRPARPGSRCRTSRSGLRRGRPLAPCR